MSEIYCEEVLRLVWQFLDGEVDEVHYHEIAIHVAECTACGPRFEFQRRLLVLIETKCREGPVPVALKQRLFRLLED